MYLLVSPKNMFYLLKYLQSKKHILWLRTVDVWKKIPLAKFLNLYAPRPWQMKNKNKNNIPIYIILLTYY